MAFRQTASSARSSVGIELARRREFAPLHGAEHVADVVALERRLAGQQAVERRTQAVDVRPRAQPIQLAPACSGLM